MSGSRNGGTAVGRLVGAERPKGRLRESARRRPTEGARCAVGARRTPGGSAFRPGVPSTRNAPPLQARLGIRAPDDGFEREAERIADRVMGQERTVAARDTRGPADDGPHQASDGGDTVVADITTQDGSRIRSTWGGRSLPTLERTFFVPRRSTPISPQSAALNLRRVIGDQGVRRLRQDREQSVDWQPLADAGAAGQPLASAARATMERRFGFDLGRVRIHAASPMADALGAKAFASGAHIWFASGRGPHDHRLLAHEMAHVVGQATARAGAARHPGGGRPSLPAVGRGTQFDFEEDVLGELRKLPSAEEEGLSDAERRRRQKVISDRRQRLRERFRMLSGKKAEALYDRLIERKEGDVLSRRFHDILATPTRRELLEILEEDILQAPPSSSDFCKPYTRTELSVLLDLADARAMYEFVDDWIAMYYGEETADLFKEYLSRMKGDSLAPKMLVDPSSEVVKGFMEDPATRRHQEGLLTTFEWKLIGNCPSLPEGVWTDVDLGTFVPQDELNQGFSFSGPTIPTIAGLIAGGISASDAGMDSRSVSGKVQMLRTVVGGRTGVRVRTRFHFVVSDALDFCPGAKGGSLAQSITIPMSRLEASGDAYDLPFEVHYDAPAIEREGAPAVRLACFGP